MGVASLAINVSGIVLARVLELVGTDLVFSTPSGGVVMLSTVIAPVVAIVGNSILAVRLATLPSLRRSTATS